MIEFLQLFLPYNCSVSFSICHHRHSQFDDFSGGRTPTRGADRILAFHPPSRTSQSWGDWKIVLLVHAVVDRQAIGFGKASKNRRIHLASTTLTRPETDVL